MSHELTIRGNGQVEMAYVGEQPWHGLGTKLHSNATLEEWIAGAGMEWEVRASPLSYESPVGRVTIPDRVALHRSDTGAPLGLVSKGYHVVQPRETITFFRDVIETMGLTMETAGTLFDGKRFWALGYIGEDSVIDRRDVVRGYLLVSSSADGGSATVAKFTSVRVVCNNTLTMANVKVGGHRVVHSTEFDPEKAKKALGLAPKTFETFMKQMRSLASTPMSEARARDLTAELMSKQVEDDKVAGRVGERIMELFGGEALGSDLEGTGGSAFGWLNAVTQYFDHDMRAKTDSHGLDSRLFGVADKLKSRALELVTAD